MSARHLARAGHNVYASMRHEDEAVKKSFRQFSSENTGTIKAVILDVTSEQSCADAVSTILSDTDHVDVVMHNAGHMCYGPAEAFSAQECMKYHDVDCLGPQRLNRAVLPHLRSRKDGLLLWVGSTSTRGGTPPFLAPYFVARSAMDSLAVSYSIELSKFGIETSIFMPGAFTQGTNHFEHAGQPDDKKVAEEYLGQGKPYKEVEASMLGKLARLEPDWADPEEIARQVVKVVNGEKGKRPFRVFIDPSDDGSEAVSEVADRKREVFYERIGMPGLLKPTA